MPEREYVLGTHEEEIERLGLQHRVWRARTLQCWERTGITKGWNVLDVGAGPGFATVDLAEIVGPRGRVTAIERSERFFQTGKSRCADQRIENVDYVLGDLVLDEIPAQNLDAAWVRWVLCFVTDPAKVVRKVAAALRAGGRFAIHEYVDYGTWRTLPERPSIREFVELVIDAWRETGGEPNIAADLPVILRDAGFRIVHLEPITFSMTPRDYAWGWPAAFVKNQPDRMVEAGQLTQELADRVRRDMDSATADPNSIMISPMVLEIIAEKA